VSRDTWRGHRIVESEDGVWLYDDTRRPVCAEPCRPCGHCGLANTPEGHDGCLGTLPDVKNACCGHGEESAAYVQFEGGRRISGRAALEWARAVTRT